MKRLCLACFLIVACGTMPCCTNNSENSNKSNAGIVAQAGSVTVTTEDLTQALKGMPGPQQFEYLSDAGRRLLVDQLLDWKFLAAEAVKAELEDDTDVRDALKKNAATGIEKAQVLGSAYLNRRIKDLPRVTDGQLRAYFEANPLEFTLPARIQVQRMMLETSPQAQEALAAVRDGMSFEQYKQKYPESRIRIDSLWLEQRENGSDFEKAAFALSIAGPSTFSKSVTVSALCVSRKKSLPGSGRLRKFARVLRRSCRMSSREALFKKSRRSCAPVWTRR